MVPSGTTETRQWTLAWDALRAVEACWEDSAARARGLLECRRLLEDCSAERLRQLAVLVHPDLTRTGFLSVLVPVERIAARTRVTDPDMGVTGTDRETARSPFPLTVVADNLRSAFNLGGVFRTADALGAEAVWLCGYSATPDHPHVARAALGAEASMPWRRWDDVRAAVASLRSSGAAVYALETSERAVAVEQHAFEFPCALLLGAERFGLDADVLAMVDALVRIEMYGRKNSLNVVSALAVAGYAARLRWNGKERAR
jgi:tRNA(Leu) C34 or U34 (ribose-2'-O)-methylase TrmL